MSVNTGIVQLVASFLFFLVAWVGFVWMLSSASLAALPCDFDFSLFHERYRCRQPWLAVMLWVTAGLASLRLLVKGLKTLKAAQRNARGADEKRR